MPLATAHFGAINSSGPHQANERRRTSGSAAELTQHEKALPNTGNSFPIRYIDLQVNVLIKALTF